MNKQMPDAGTYGLRFLGINHSVGAEQFLFSAVRYIIGAGGIELTNTMGTPGAFPVGACMGTVAFLPNLRV